MSQQREDTSRCLPGCADVSRQEYIDLANESLRNQGDEGYWTESGNRTFYVAKGQIVVNGHAVDNDPLK